VKWGITRAGDPLAPVWHHQPVTTGRLADEETAWIPRAENPQPVPTALAAAAAVALTALLYLAAHGGTAVFAAATLVVQLLLVAVWCLVTRPPSAVSVGAVGAASALLATGILAFSDTATAAPAGSVVAVAFIATIVTQLARRGARRQVTEAFGSTMTLVVAVAALSTAVSLHRDIGGSGLVAASVTSRCPAPP
jgi:hypothetical protein